MSKNFFFLLIIIVAVSIRIPFLNREFVLEEALNVKDARAIAQTGYPQVYAGEQAPQYIHLDRTPGLFFALAASFKMFSESEISARIVPLLFFLGQLLLIFYFTSRIFKYHYQKLISLLAGFFFAIHPYIIQNSLHIHYDGAVFAFFSTWYLFLACQKIIKHQNRWQDHLPLATIFFFALFVKYDPAAVMLFIVIVFSRIIWKPFLKKLLISTTISSSLFFGLFYLYNAAFNHTEAFLLPFAWINQVVSGKLIAAVTNTPSLSLWANNYFLLIRFLSWLTIPFILLAIYTFLIIFREKNLKKDPGILFLSLWFFTFCISYLALGWSGDFPRYFAPAMPPLFMLITVVVIRHFTQFKLHLTSKTITLVLILASSIIFLLEKADYLFSDRITGWVPYLQIPFFGLIVLGIFLIVFVIINRSKRILLITLLILLSVNFYQFITQYRHDLKSNYSLTNFYGYGGYREAGNFLKKEIRHKNAIILTFDPVAYYWQGKFLDYNLFGPPSVRDNAKIIDFLLSNQITAIALPDVYSQELAARSQNYGLNYQKLLSEKFKNHRNFGGQKGIDVYY